MNEDRQPLPPRRERRQKAEQRRRTSRRQAPTAPAASTAPDTTIAPNPKIAPTAAAARSSATPTIAAAPTVPPAAADPQTSGPTSPPNPPNAGGGARPSRGGGSLPPSWVVAAWALGTLIPLAAYASPLWEGALSDTPTAYLIWVPILAIGWGAWLLRTSPPYPDDSELNGILGFGLLALVGATLVVGPQEWPYRFVWQNGGLLLWPLWALGMTWLLYGVGATRRCVAPLVFLFLAWPPFLTAIAAEVQTVLLATALDVLHWAAGFTAWVHSSATQGSFLVEAHGSWVPVIVNQACSGADSVLGAAILLPLLLALLNGSRWAKLALVPIAIVGAMALNLLRLGIIMTTLHFFGVEVALGIIHPLLGFVLFAALGFLLLAIAGLMGLTTAAAPAGPRVISKAGPVHVAIAGLSAAAVFILLLPLFSLPFGAVANPLPIASTNMRNLMPTLPDFVATNPQFFDDSSILGPGSISIAQVYNAKGGAAVLAEYWSTPNLQRLRSYGFRDCLLFHGQNLLAAHAFEVAPGQTAAVYAVDLPGSGGVYVDVEWSGALTLPDGTTQYLRYAVAALPQPDSTWPSTLRQAKVGKPVAGLAAMAVGPNFGDWTGLMDDRTLIQNFASSFLQAFQKQARQGDHKTAQANIGATADALP